jgi:hypothetical protein
LLQQLRQNTPRPLTVKAFPLWSAPLEHFRLDGEFLYSQPPLLNMFQGHAVDLAQAKFRAAAAPVCGCADFALPQLTIPGAPFECLEPELAPAALILRIT